MRHEVLAIVFLTLVCCEFSEEVAQGPPDSSKKPNDKDDASEAQSDEEIITFDESDAIKVNTGQRRQSFTNLESVEAAPGNENSKGE